MVVYEVGLLSLEVSWCKTYIELLKSVFREIWEVKWF